MNYINTSQRNNILKKIIEIQENDSIVYKQNELRKLLSKDYFEKEIYSVEKFFNGSSDKERRKILDILSFKLRNNDISLLKTIMTFLFSYNKENVYNEYVSIINYLTRNSKLKSFNIFSCKLPLTFIKSNKTLFLENIDSYLHNNSVSLRTNKEILKLINVKYRIFKTGETQYFIRLYPKDKNLDNAPPYIKEGEEIIFSP